MRASRVEDEIRESFPQANVKIASGSQSDFQVIVDETIIFDKIDESINFPRIFEITNLIKELKKL